MMIVKKKISNQSLCCCDRRHKIQNCDQNLFCEKCHKPKKDSRFDNNLSTSDLSFPQPIAKIVDENLLLNHPLQNAYLNSSNAKIDNNQEKQDNKDNDFLSQNLKSEDLNKFDFCDKTLLETSINSSEVELISLRPQERIPKYKLRVDTITGFTGYSNNDWLVETPIIDLEAPIDLNPVFIRETFKYFIQSGARLTQMTKVYNDVEALTKLLEEKESDLEFVVHLGQSLLTQNQSQNEKILELEEELAAAKEKIVQLKHEITSKKDLLSFYIKDEDGENDEYEVTDCSISSFHSAKNISFLLEELEKKVGNLESENLKLRNEKEIKVSDIEKEERKELHLINEYARKFSLTNRQLISLQEEVSKKTEENSKLHQEVKNLSSQVFDLEKKIRKSAQENESLESALNLSHECQSDLTLELIDIKEKHDNLLTAFHEKQEECRQLINSQIYNPIFSYVDSLAYELQNSVKDNSSCEYDMSVVGHSSVFNNFKNSCFTPDSLFSNESFNSNNSLNVSIEISSNEKNTNLSSVPENSNTNSSSSTAKCLPISNKNFSASLKPNRSLFFTDKLRYIKPIEGSQILNRWRKLANPNLGNLFEDRERFVSRIQANLAAIEIENRLVIKSSEKNKNSDSAETQNLGDFQFQKLNISSTYQNNFVSTNSIFTFTTTSLSHTKDSVTAVTTSFNSVEPSTGRNDFSIRKHSIDRKSICFQQKHSINSLSDHNLVKETTTVKIKKDDTLPHLKTEKDLVKNIDSGNQTLPQSSDEKHSERLHGLNKLSELIDHAFPHSSDLFKSKSQDANLSNKKTMIEVMNHSIEKRLKQKTKNQ